MGQLLMTKIGEPYKVHLVSGFILSGWLYIYPTWIKLPDETVKQFAVLKIPENKIKKVYTWQIIKEKLKCWLAFKKK